MSVPSTAELIRKKNTQMNITHHLITLTILLLTSAADIHAQTVLTPRQFGWDKAKNGKERFMVLRAVQTEAVKTGATVDYSGMGTVTLEYPGQGLHIPLTGHDDFKGMVINITNTVQSEYIFTHQETAEPVSIAKKNIDNGNFSKTAALRQGDFLLSVSDRNTWGIRNGYTDPVVRSDLMRVTDGRTQDSPVMPYNNRWSDPECRIYIIRKTPFTVKNLTVNRVGKPEKRTMVMALTGLYDVRLSHITINTSSPGQLYGDEAIRITDCMKVEMDSITINGTYSQKDHYGYGISLTNVTDFTARHLTAHGVWGIFGNRSINRALLEDCDINRWDLHYYGRDITLRRCTVSTQYNQYSSVYGTVAYDSCRFVNCRPFLVEWSYNAYTAPDVIFSDCTLEADNADAALFDLRPEYSKDNPRHELSTRQWPKATIHNLHALVAGQKYVIRNLSLTGYPRLITPIRQLGERE